MAGTDFTPIDAAVAHQAFIDMREAAKRHEERKPGCVQAQTYTKKANHLLVLRNKILDRLPEEFHGHRVAYPDYVPNPAAVTIAEGSAD